MRPPKEKEAYINKFRSINDIELLICIRGYIWCMHLIGGQIKGEIEVVMQ